MVAVLIFAGTISYEILFFIQHRQQQNPKT